MDISRADVGAAREAIGREMIAGFKARLSRDVTGPNDFEVFRRSLLLIHEWSCEWPAADAGAMEILAPTVIRPDAWL